MQQQYVAPYQQTAYYSPYPQSKSPEAAFFHIQRVQVNSLNKQGGNRHIQQLWLTTQLDAWIHQFDCEDDSGAGCKIMPLYIFRSLFSNRKPEHPKAFINGYSDYEVNNPRLCTTVLCTGYQTAQKALFQVTDTRQYLILGCETAQQIG